MISQDYDVHGEGSAAEMSDDDLSYLLPVVTPILDEYDEEEESTGDADADIDHYSILGLTDRAAQYQHSERDYRDTLIEDDGMSVASDVTEYSAVSEELLYYHNVIARRAMSLSTSEVFDEDAASDFSASDHGLETTPTLPHDDPLFLRRTVPQLPRPRLWTVSERGESTATKNSARCSPRNNSLRFSETSRVREENNDGPFSKHGGNGFCMWLSEAGAKALTKPAKALTALSRGPKMTKKASTWSCSSPRSVSIPQEDPTVATEPLDSFSFSRRDDSFRRAAAPSLDSKTKTGAAPSSDTKPKTTSNLKSFAFRCRRTSSMASF
mmetsp:Transcript_9803/g.18616  ORF Transcript_9803/g.18616 Transcript_9803/m.18616 type:complete len:325 (-) Transcript_9803:131-1105(-)